MTPRQRPQLFGRDIRRIHCVGVAGMGVGPLAIYLAQLGFVVSGEDDALTDEMRAVLTQGGVGLGPMPADCELVACSSAIAPAHPATRLAGARQLPVVRRGELLAEATRAKKLVAVCGSHGKTTTTAMLVTALRAAQFPAGYVLGGLFADATPPADAGQNEWVVAEIDESDGTIERFSPEITVAVNLDWDHPDHYRRRADIEAAFADLFRRTRGTVLVCDTCAMSARVVEAVSGSAAAGVAEPGRPGSPTPAPTQPRQPGPGRTVIRGRSVFTFGRGGDFRGEIGAEAGDEMNLRLGGRFSVAEARVRARGDFNAANATAALAAAQLIGAHLRPDLLAGYPAVRRRQFVLHAGDFLVLEDYAHHPAEIRALLGSLRARVTSPGRLVVVFQPHRFSRTAQFKAEFASALAGADLVQLLDVYPAGEAPVPGGTTADVHAELKQAAPVLPVRYAPGPAVPILPGVALTAGDVVAFVGAGDIDRKARAWLAGLRAATPEAR